MTSEPRIPASLSGSTVTRRAIAYADRMHEGQRRSSDGAPFIEHPLEVARLLEDVGAPDHVIAAGVLHDVLEKSDADAEDLQARFGDRITTLVLAVTEDERIRGWAARKAALREQVAAAGREALMVFAADKISKAREQRVEEAGSCQQPGSRRPDRRLAYYRRCLQLL
ncbi:MAG TPA: HD domain-containing protein, partial [Solirubrobacteraceae bacterium]|nr:HD domain-containing protein [Solirubrobacteraceae bacterium]